MTIERIYNVPLRKETQKTARYKRAKKAVKALKEFLQKHMKAEFDNIKIGKYLNELIWENGIKNPPHHVKINVVKDDEGIVKAELFGAPVVEKKTKKTVHKKKTEEKAEDLEVKAEETKEEKSADDKKKKAEHEKEETMKHEPEKTKRGHEVLNDTETNHKMKKTLKAFKSE